MWNVRVYIDTFISCLSAVHMCMSVYKCGSSRHDTGPFCSQVTAPTVAADSGWQCQDSRPAQAAAKPHINLIYPCRSSSPDPVTRSPSIHAGRNTSAHTQNKTTDSTHNTQSRIHLNTNTSCVPAFLFLNTSSRLTAILCSQWNVWKITLRFCFQLLKVQEDTGFFSVLPVQYHAQQYKNEFHMLPYLSCAVLLSLHSKQE